MKLSLKIMTALFIFAVIGITSCTKNEFGLDVEENIENYNFSEFQQFKQNISEEKLFSELKNKKGIKITKNYFHSESGCTGTLYEYINFKGKTEMVLEVKEKPSVKAVIRSVVTVVYTDVNGDIMVTDHECTGSGTGCMGFTNLYIAWR